MSDKGLQIGHKTHTPHVDVISVDSIALDKTIFSNVFEKDIRRVYIYKKSERLAKAIQLILPAFRDTKALRDKLQHICMRLIDAAVSSPQEAKESLSKELLSLSSVLAVARTGGILSPMNTDIISREAHNLLQEIAGYDDPKVSFEDAPSLATLAKATQGTSQVDRPHTPVAAKTDKGQSIGHTGNTGKDDRKVAIVSILQSKGPSFIKDISMLIRDVSEKTIQRELQSLILSGKVKKTGERRWTTYELVQ